MLRATSRGVPRGTGDSCRTMPAATSGSRHSDAASVTEDDGLTDCGWTCERDRRCWGPVPTSSSRTLRGSTTCSASELPRPGVRQRGAPSTCSSTSSSDFVHNPGHLSTTPVDDEMRPHRPQRSRRPPTRTDPIGRLVQSTRLRPAPTDAQQLALLPDGPDRPWTPPLGPSETDPRMSQQYFHPRHSDPAQRDECGATTAEGRSRCPGPPLDAVDAGRRRPCVSRPRGPR
jgi:hypothetical protein